MNNNSLSNKLSKLAEQIDGSEKLYTDVLANKVAKYFKEFPSDSTLGQFNIILKKMASTRETISKAEFKSLYNKLYSSGSNFSTIFKKELGEEVELQTPKYATKDTSKVENTFADPILTNIFASIYENKEFKLYSDKLAKQATDNISNILESFNLIPKELKVEEGNSDVLVAKASYETPKGYSYIYIPIAIKDNKVKQASVFVGSNGLNDLTKDNIKNYLLNTVGVKFNVTATDIFKMLVKTAAKNETVSAVDLAYASLNNNKREHLGLTRKHCFRY